MRALISGLAGFIGSRLAEALIAHGYEVSGIDNLSTGRKENVPPGARLHVGDIRDGVPFGNYDTIFHCAASYKDRMAWEGDASTNVLGTLKVIREAKRTGAKIVYFQTSLCYGPNPASPVQIDAPLDPRGSYAVSKTAGEAFIRDSGAKYVSLRLANIYGPRNLSGPIPTFWKRLKEGQPCTVVDSRRDFVYVDDLIWVAVKAATQGEGAYHVSSGHDYPISAVYRAVALAMGAEPPDPTMTLRGPDDVATLLLSPEATTREFGWRAQTALADGIAKAVAYYEREGVAETFSHLEGLPVAR